MLDSFGKVDGDAFLKCGEYVVEVGDNIGRVESEGEILLNMETFSWSFGGEY